MNKYKPTNKKQLLEIKCMLTETKQKLLPKQHLILMYIQYIVLYIYISS